MIKRAEDSVEYDSIQDLIEKLKISPYQPILDVVFKYDGCVFGGFLRDFVQNKPPMDMDIIKPCHETAKFQQWINEITALGYGFSENDLEEQFYTCANLVTLHIIEDDEPIENTRLSPCCNPDYNVNFLAMDKHGIFNWVDMSDVMVIVKNIQRNEAKAYQPDPARQAKMFTKGFKILPEVYECKDCDFKTPTAFMAVATQMAESQRQIAECEKRIADYKKQLEESEKFIAEYKGQIAK
jgi:hypothetical protein